MGSPVVHFEIMGTDGPALSGFYADLFGWGIQPMPEMNYTLVDTRAGSGINGGIGTAEAGEHRVLFYAAVPDPQATLDLVEARGGKTALPVSEIPGVVTLAQFLDPQGNVVGIVKDAEPGQEGGGGPSAGSGAPVSWFEVLGPDPAALASFYGEVFGWTPRHADAGGTEYIEVDPGTGRSGSKGISGAIGSARDGTAKVHLYASVDDLQACCDKTTALGGGVAVPPMKVGEEIEFAHLLDPQGNTFGIWRPLG
ncbi:MAG TPA: VOC family protein [Actinomycetota bacterium]